MATTCAGSAGVITCSWITNRKRNEYAKGAKMNSEFEVWFVEQHGKRNYGWNEETDQELRIMAAQGEWSKRELESRRVYDARRESALYAWNARTK